MNTLIIVILIILLTVSVSIIVIAYYKKYFVIIDCKNPSADNYNPYALIHNNDMCINKIVNESKSESETYNSIKLGKNILMNDYIKNKIFAMASNDKVVLVVDDYVVLDSSNNSSEYTGLNVVVLERDNINKSIRVKDKKVFAICNVSEMENFKKYITDKIDHNDVVIILSKGDTFVNIRYNVYDLSILKMVGARLCRITDDSNYLLIGSKKGDIYYEGLSEDKTTPLFFPFINITDSECRVNPATIFPIKNNMFYMEKAPYDEKIIRCAMESAMRGYSRFGVVNNRCVPLSDNDYNKVSRMDSSNDCLFGGSATNVEGSADDRYVMNVYKFDRSTSSDDVIGHEKGVVLFDDTNYLGRKVVLQEGEYYGTDYNKQSGYGRYGGNDGYSNSGSHDIVHNIRSIIVPDNYFVILMLKSKNYTDAMNCTKSLIGPVYVADVKEKIVGVDIRRYKNSSVVFCNSNNVVCDKNNRCFVLEPGKHVLSPHLINRIVTVNMGDSVKEVSLYSDINFSDIVQKFIKDDRKIYTVSYPRYIRSIKIL